MIGDYSTPLLVFASTILTGFVSAIVPAVNAEVFVVFLGGVISPQLYPVAVILATLSHMAGKAVIYGAARSVHSLPDGAIKRRIVAVQSKVSGRTSVGSALLFVSALVGLPPFYVMTVLCGVVRFNFAYFFIIGFAGRLIRFAALILLPQVARALLP